MTRNTFKSGFVAIVGRPNTGKSTLINNLVQRKIAITSSKPQTTRHRIQAVVNRPNSQIIFIDTPGFHKPLDLLGQRMLRMVRTVLSDVDIILFILDSTAEIGKGDRYLAGELEGLEERVIALLNKVDIAGHEQVAKNLLEASRLGNYREFIPISAVRGDNLELTIQMTESLLPEGPRYYPPGQISDQPEGRIIAEYIREKVIELTEEEVPYSVAVEVESIGKRKGRDLIDVSAIIYVERESQKGIVIGEKGKMLREIGVRARRDSERLLGSQINLKLWVKVKKDWRKRMAAIEEFGYGGS